VPPVWDKNVYFIIVIIIIIIIIISVYLLSKCNLNTDMI